MSGQQQRIKNRARGSRQRPSAPRMFGPMVAAGASAYARTRDLPRLLALWPHELDDESREGGLRVLAKIRRALRAERRRALAGHWSYDLNRHLGLLSAYKGELARLAAGGAKLNRTAPAAGRTRSAAGAGDNAEE